MHFSFIVIFLLLMILWGPPIDFIIGSLRSAAHFSFGLDPLDLVSFVCPYHVHTFGLPAIAGPKEAIAIGSSCYNPINVALLMKMLLYQVILHLTHYGLNHSQ